MPEIIINGKFFTAKLEGMPRVARELTRCFDYLVERSEFKDFVLKLAVPKDGCIDLPNFKNIEVHKIGRFSGFLWEQIDFPLFARKNFTFNCTSTAPLILKNGCVIVHDAQFKSTAKSHSLKSFILYNVITTFVINRFKIITTISNYAKKEILEFKVTKRKDILIIPNGIDHLVNVNPDFKILDKLKIKKGAYALSNSYVHAHKNIPILFEAFKKLGSEYKLVLFGTSIEKDYIERGMLPPQNVIFAGRISNDELSALIKSANIFLFPSYTEGFGLPPLEAMSLGCPTICSNAGAMPDNCKDGVIYAEPHEAADWKNKIEMLWNDNNKKNFLSTRGKEVSSTFKWEDAAVSYLNLFRSQST